MNRNVLEIIFVSIMAGLLVTLGWFANDAIKQSNFLLQEDIYSNNTECTGLGMEDTSECLRQQLSSFYKYNLSQTGKKLTNEQFITEGGVCTHASQWYSEKLNKLGYDSQKVSITKNETSGHVFTVMESDEGYCILDQHLRWCMKYAN